MEFTHFDQNGNARMVDVSDKGQTKRVAVARGTIKVSRQIFEAVTKKTIKKGDVLSVAVTAGIMGAKKTWELIPMCHLLPLENCHIVFEPDEAGLAFHCVCTVTVTGKTGVEMEALTGVSTALLTFYDMCKAVDKGMEIGDIYLVSKSGGKSGLYERGERTDDADR